MKIEFGDRILPPEPKAFNARLRKIGGLTPNGRPWFRLVYGWTRMGWIGGWEYDCIRDSGGEPLTDLFGRALDLIIIEPTQLAPKYKEAGLDRWFLEMWNPPEMYGTPETWIADFSTMVPDHEGMAVRGCDLPGGTVIEQLGPYPDRGDYEIVMTFEEIKGQQLPEQSVMLAMEFARRARTMTDEFRFAARYRQLKEEAARKKIADKAAAKELLEKEWEKLPKRHVGPGRSPQVGYVSPVQYGSYPARFKAARSAANN